MNKIYLLLIVLAIWGCSDDSNLGDAYVDDFRIESYFASMFVSNFNLGLVKFEYDLQGEIKRKIGYVSKNSNGINSFYDFINTDLTYEGNKVFFILNSTHSNSYILAPDITTSIEFDYLDRMVQKVIITNANFDPINTIKDTINYKYSNGKLISYERKYKNIRDVPFIYERSELFYTNDNLDSIVKIVSNTNGLSPTGERLIYKEYEIFSGYDAALNPFRKLSIFSDTFKRSVSKNNSGEYSRYVAFYSYPNNDLNQLPNLAERLLKVRLIAIRNYDESGNLIYN